MSNSEYPDNEEIKEERGWLPQWWMILLYGSIVFSLIYAVYMHGIVDWSQEKQYREEAARYEKMASKRKIVTALAADGSNPLRGDAAAIAAGAKTYQTTCAPCHKPDGTGSVGPNIVDNKWLHGSTDRAVFNVVMNGVGGADLKQKPAMGIMPPHKDSIKAMKVLEIMAWMAEKNHSLKKK